MISVYALEIEHQEGLPVLAAFEDTMLTTTPTAKIINIERLYPIGEDEE